ncbi:MAG: hypothetical protein HXY34_11585 [Candidatus Thorarchaeota archaeon]|nr:hypothetical protein [Candidatus Thorarchaeota archaeon]
MRRPFGSMFSSSHTTELWYDRANNAMRSFIPGNLVTLGPVTNASRIVSYVVIRVLRYDDVAMVDLRVQDMELVVDLRGTLPWVPAPPPDEEPVGQPGDGTTTGSADEKPGLAGIVESALAVVGEVVQVYLTGWWPLVHLVIDFIVMPGVEVYAHATIDLLGDYNFEYFNVRFLGCEDYSEEQSQALLNGPEVQQTMKSLDLVVAQLGVAVILGWFAARIAASFGTPSTEWIVWALIGAASALQIMFYILTIEKYLQSRMEPVVAGWLFLGFALSMLTAAFLAFKSALDIANSYKGSGGILKFFEERFWINKSERMLTNGLKGRCNVVMMVALMFLAFTAFWMGLLVVDLLRQQQGSSAASMIT